MSLKDDIDAVLKVADNTITPAEAADIADIFENLTSGQQDNIKNLCGDIADATSAADLATKCVNARNKIHCLAMLAKGEATPDLLQWP